MARPGEDEHREQWEQGGQDERPFLGPQPLDAQLLDRRVVRLWGPLDDATVAKMKGFGVDLERSSGQTHHEIAIPSLFLIDRTGVVRWAHSDPDFKVRPSTAQILAAIDVAKLTDK